MKTTTRRFLALAVMLILSATAIMAQFYVTKSSPTYMYERPDEQSAKECAFNEGDTVRHLTAPNNVAVGEDWDHVLSNNGHIGYMRCSELEYIGEVYDILGVDGEAYTEEYHNGIVMGPGIPAYWVGTKTSSKTPFYVMVALSLLMLITCIRDITSNKDNPFANSPLRLYVSTGIMLCAFISQWFYLVTYAGKPMWFLRPSVVGWLLTITNFVIMSVTVTFQSAGMLYYVHALNYQGRRVSDLSVGIYGTMGCIALLFVGCMFFGMPENWVAVLFGIVQLAQVGVFVMANRASRGSTANLIFTLLFYATGIAITVLLLATVLAYVLAAMFVAVLIYGMLVSPGLEKKPKGANLTTRKPYIDPTRNEGGADAFKTEDGEKFGHWVHNIFHSWDGRRYDENGIRIS